MVEEPVNHAKRQGDEIYKSVEDWLNSVDDFTEKVAKPITGGEDEAKKRCFKGLCPNLGKRYSLSKKAVKAEKQGADLLINGNFNNVSYRPALEKTELVRVRGYEQFDSRLQVFQDVMEVLNDSNVDMIGVYGMGGVGKTTLVKQVAKKVIEDKLFDEVAMAEVTQTPDYRKIQDKIARDLGLEFGQQESMVRRADLLRVILKKEKRVLIILDNIWTKFEFDDVGIPFRDDENQRKNDQRRCTIILTSRSRDLLSNDMNTLKNFPIEVLSNREAEQLFEKIVGDSARQSDFQRIGHEIVKRCGGLPVALNTIANALKNKSLLIWKEALDQLRNSTPREIHGMKANVYSSIELSYNFLESDEAKHLFLLCSLLRACDCLYFSYLLRYGMGLGLFKNVGTLKSARYRVHKLIDSLKASCLLLDGDAEDEIKMHDIIFAVAVSIAEEKLMFNIQNAADLKEERINKDSTAISIPYNIQELPERLEFPQLELFLLSDEYGSSLQIPDLLFEGMKQLKVLNLTKFWFPSLPSSLGCLINLQTLCLEKTSRFMGLDGLEKITLLGMKMLVKRTEDLFLKKLEGLQNIVDELDDKEGFPRLKHLHIETCYEISNIVSLVGQIPYKVFPLLESLSLHNLINLEKVCQCQLTDNQSFSNLMIIKVKECHRLKHLFSFSMAKNLLRLQKIKVGDCSNLEMIVGPDMEKSTTTLGYKKVISEDDSQVKVLFPSLEELKLDSLISIENICHNMQFQYQNLKKVTLRNCKSLKFMFSYSMVSSLVQLEHLDIQNCDSMEAVVVDTTSTRLGRDEGKLIEMVFPKLYYLRLLGLPKLTSFAIGMAIHLVEFPSLSQLAIIDCPNLKRFISMSSLDDNILTEIFDEKVALPSLMALHVGGCDVLRSLMTLSMAQSMVKLTRMEITGCERMEEIIQQELGEEVKDDRIVFTQLKYLQLASLPSLKSFCLGNYTLEFSSLEQVYVRDCQNMKTFSQGVLLTPKLHEVNLRFYTEEGYWEGNLNSTIQKIFKEMVGFRDIWDLRLSLHPRLKEIWHS